jgi:succinate-acetate transporter protein
MAEIQDRVRGRYGTGEPDEAVIEGAAPALPVADPAPLGLGAFALTTFLLSGHNAGFIPDIAWLGVALFYGGTIQLLAGMWEFRNRNVFGATAFSTYGGFWLGLGSFVILAELTKLGDAIDNVDNALAWFLIAFAIFNTYMLLWSMRVNYAVFGVFLTLEVTEILLAIGFFNLAHGGSDTILKAGGWAGIVTAAVAWYASAAGVVNGMSPSRVVPVGHPFWGTLPAPAQPTSPMPRRSEG